MQPSRKRHPLAILRLTLGFTQKEMAELVGTAMMTIQAIESGKRPLKEKLAEHIAAISGVQLYWLLAGDPKAPIVAESGEPYTRQLFERNKRLFFDHKHSKARREAEYAFMPEILALALLSSYSILRHAHGQQRLAWATYKLQTAIDGVARELGTDETTDEKIEQLTIDHPMRGKFDAAVHLVKQAHRDSAAE